ncbi:PilC/PilY family type IV pilus protein [Aquincola sp. MAHUQ-54]|uniref:PilC/PilY family type IV pilus protein n=1 Tax=Aquincola agrisoli TaxID=3119538 RepID=A0AAW9QAR1_9BURK
MKKLACIARSWIALAGLALSTAACATDVSKRPLRVDSNVKPNVIFGMDDSGSMDWEILVSADSGLIWWDRTTKSYWGDGGFLRTGWYYMYYLFPVDWGNGGNLYSEYSGVVPPSPQFAPARSAAYNPLYYNPSVTYAPWPTAFHDSQVQVYQNADPTAAKSHPAVPASITMNLTADRSFDIYYEAGMLRPDGTIGEDWAYISTSYFPATYWVLDDSCVASSHWASTCVVAPDGRKLRKYEIRPGNTFPSGRNYANEIQNFANWWSYYRKRKLMLAGAMGTVLDDLTGMRLGVVHFNSYNRVALTMYDADSGDSASNRHRVAGMFYTNPADGRTPTASTLNEIGQRYLTDNQVIQYSCQRNNAFIVTDGFANDSYTPPAYDAGLYGSGAPYQTTTPGSIADVALSYFTLNLRNGRTASGEGRALSDGRVPLTNQGVKNPDKNQNLHMNTYGITLGARGTIWPGITDPFAATFAWPYPAPDTAASIDDLWHATINGRGQMYVADDAQQAAINIRDGLNDMINQTGAQSAVAVSSPNLARSDGKAYMGLYTTGSWGGDVTANTLNTSTGAITTQVWSAAEQLNQRTSPRVISTFRSPFTAAAVGSRVSANAAGRAALFDFLRGSRSGEGTTYRRRTSVLGAVINAKPVVLDKVVYAASGEGMLHAFDADTGSELWAYVPGFVLSGMAATASRNYYFETLLDGTPSVAALSSTQKVLVAGRGAGGGGYYALDISAARQAMTEQQRGDTALWEIVHGGDFILGQSVGRPVVVNTRSHGWVALITQGYNGSTDGRGRLYMVSATTGALLRTFTVSGDSAGDLGLAQVTAALESDGRAVHVYGGDLQGNLWHFNLEDGTAARMATFMFCQQVQPITAAPEIVLVGKQRVVLVGTGRMLGPSDFNATTTQSFYAIKDDGATLAAEAVRNALVQRTVATNGSAQTMTGPALDWSQKSGWYFDLPSNLQVTTTPTAAYGGAVFTGNKTNTADCWAASSLFVIDFTTGKNLGRSEWVMTALSERSTASAALVFNPDKRCTGECSSGVGAPPPPKPPCASVVKSDGTTECKEIDPDTGVESRRNAWRQIRLGDR